MRLVAQHHIKPSDTRYTDLLNLCRLSKNLYNSGLYAVRKHFFETGKFLSFPQLAKKFAEENQVDSRALPAKVAQQTLKLVEQNFKSFFGSLKGNGKKSRIPKYLKKDGYFPTTYTVQAMSKVKLRQGIIKLSGTDLEFPTDKKVQQVRIIPRTESIVLEVVYIVPDVPKKDDNFRYASIDLGLNNLATLGTNIGKGLIINGKPLKSINQSFNKRKAQLQSLLKGSRKTSKQIHQIMQKRNNKIKDYLHKASRYIVNYLVFDNLNILVIEYNKE